MIRHLKGISVQGSQRITQAMADLEYHPSEVARSLKSGKTMTLGVVVPDVTNPFFAAVVKGAESVADASGYSVVLYTTNESAEREHRVLAGMRGRVDGLLLATARDDAETAESLSALGIPVVLVDRTFPEPGPTDTVLIDNVGGAVAAAEHLLTLGHHRIGLISGPFDTTPGAERHDSFVDACAGVAHVSVEHGDFRERGGYQATMRLFGRVDAPTAVFAANNLMTVGLLRALHDLGLQVPGDVSVIGFDDHLLADLLDPPLTVVDRPTDTQGAVATRMLLARLSGTASGPGRTVRLDTNLVVRSSTSSPSSRAARSSAE